VLDMEDGRAARIRITPIAGSQDDGAHPGDET
jgi:hypothetical protein